MIKGKCVGIRAVENQDLELLKSWRNNPSFRKNFREHRELNSADQLKWLNFLQSDTTRNFMFSIIDLSTGELIGACGLLYVNWIIRSADFSFYIGKDDKYIDDVFAADAAKLLIKYGFDELNLNKIWMELYEFDFMKLEFFKKHFNFSIDGRLRQNCFKEGKLQDSFILSLLRTDLKA